MGGATPPLVFDVEIGLKFEDEVEVVLEEASGVEVDVGTDADADVTRVSEVVRVNFGGCKRGYTGPFWCWFCELVSTGAERVMVMVVEEVMIGFVVVAGASGAVSLGPSSDNVDGGAVDDDGDEAENVEAELEGGRGKTGVEA